MPVFQTFAELPPEERKQMTQIVGGCGLLWNSVSVTEDPSCAAIYAKSFSNLQTSAAEQLFPVSLDDENVNGYVFKLNFGGFPATKSQDYEWMRFNLTRQEPQAAMQKAETFSSVQNLDLETFKEKIEQKENLEAKDLHGVNLIHYAAMSPDSRYLEAMIQTGADLNAADSFGYTALHYAAKEGKTESIELLLKQGIAIDIQAKNRITPLYFAAQHGQIAAVRLLLAKGANSNSCATHGMTSLYCAIHHGFEDIALLLIEHPHTDVNIALEDDTTALYLSCALEKVSIAKALLAKGVQVNKQRVDGYAPLHIVAQEGSVEMCALLLQHEGLEKVDPNLKLRSGKTALHLAVKENDPAIVKLLLDHDAVLTVYGWERETPLHDAIRYGNSEAVNYMIPYANDIVTVNEGTYRIIDLPDLNEGTPLKIALNSRFYEAIEALLMADVSLPPPKEFVEGLCQAKVDPAFIKKVIKRLNLQKDDLKDAFYICAKNGHKLMVTFFTQVVGMDDFCDAKGRSLVHYAAQFDHVDILSQFIATSPSDLLRVDQEQKSLAAIAAENGSSRVLRMLLSAMDKHQIPLTSQYQEHHLLLAALNGSKQDCADLILRKMKDPNMPLDEQQRYAIHIAAMRGDVEMLEFLRNRGADFTQKDQAGHTVFHYAFEYKWDDVVSYLFDNQYQFKMPDDILHFVIEKGATKHVSLLIKKGCNPSQFHSETALPPIFYAIERDDLSTIIALDKEGAELKARSKIGETPLLYAARLGNLSALKFFVEKIGGRKQKTLKGKTALHLAAESGHEVCVGYLLKQEFDPTLKDKQHQTAIDLAQERGHYNIVSILKGQSKELEQHKRRVIEALIRGDEASFFAGTHYLSLNQPMVLVYENQAVTIPLLLLIYQLSFKYPGAKKILNAYLNYPGVDKETSIKEGETLTHFMISREKPSDLEGLDTSIKDKNDCSLLHYAAIKSNPQQLAALLKNSTSVNREDKDGFTPLMYAITHDKEANVQVLLEQGANPNQVSKALLTPLTHAINNKRPLIAFLLLKHGADVNQTCTYQKKTPLHRAIEQELDENVIKKLIAYGANVNQEDLLGNRPVHSAAHEGNLTIMRMLVAAGASLNVQNLRGWTVMHCAVLSHNLKLLEELQRYGLSINHPSEPQTTDHRTKSISPMIRKSNEQESGVTPVHIAVKEGNLKTLHWLKSQGWDVEVLTEKRHSALFYATRSKKIQVMQFFADHPHLKNADQRYHAIHGAISHDCVKLLKSFYGKENPADLSLDSNGTTGLYLAAIYGSRRCSQYLIKKGADPQRPNLHNSTPFETAIKSHHLGLARHFAKVSKTFDIHRTLEGGKTYLHWACEHADMEMAAWLIELGLKLNAVDNQGLTPLHYAAKQARYPLLHLLLACGAIGIKGKKDGKKPLDLIPEFNESLIKLYHKYQQAHHKRRANKETCLHLAILQNDYQHLPLLIQINDLQQQNIKGQTALHLAALAKKTRGAQQLIEAGALLDLKDDKGRTSLFLAASKGRSAAMVQLFLSFNAHLNTTNLNRETILYAVARRSLNPTTRKMFDVIYQKISSQVSEKSTLYFAKSDFQNLNAFFRKVHQGVQVDEQTLLTALKYEADEVLDNILTWFKVDSKIKDREGKSLLQIAYDLNHKKIFKIIQKHMKKTENLDSPLVQESIIKDNVSSLLDCSHMGLDFFQTDGKGNSYLHEATRHKGINVLKFLLWLGLDINSVNAEGKAPLHLATSAEDLSMVKLLLDYGANIQGWASQVKHPESDIFVE